MNGVLFKRWAKSRCFSYSIAFLFLDISAKYLSDLCQEYSDEKIDVPTKVNTQNNKVCTKADVSVVLSLIKAISWSVFFYQTWVQSLKINILVFYHELNMVLSTLFNNVQKVIIINATLVQPKEVLNKGC